jgi:hypothetical protein
MEGAAAVDVHDGKFLSVRVDLGAESFGLVVEPDSAMGFLHCQWVLVCVPVVIVARRGMRVRAGFRLKISIYGRRENVSTASTSIISNLKGATAPTANTIKAANAAGIDIGGMLALAQIKALELKTCLSLMVRAIDEADPNLTTLDNILASLS